MHQFLAAMMIAIGVFPAATQQQEQPSPFEFGKMWTFENPPKEWFKEAYDFEAGDDWFDEVRKSSLRFATWCSASFVSPDGLIMTNHHCAVPAIADVQKEGEDLFKTGFYAESEADERRAPGLFVEQLIQVADVSDHITAVTENAENEADRRQKTMETLQTIQAEYEQKEGWMDLRLQVVSYYSGTRFSIYGYKRFSDIRLVFLPEEDLGFFGGDPDNFTYPRYNLDCSFWRAYDSNGDPLNTSDHYFKFNPDGIASETPVFIVGNPGSTERYRTISQLEYDRDYRYPIQLQYLKDRLKLMERMYERESDVELKSDILSYSNSIKAINGIVEGLNNPDLFSKKERMEEMIRSEASSQEYWDLLTGHYEVLSQHTAEIFLLSPNPAMMGQALVLSHEVYGLQQMIEAGASEEEMDALKSQIKERASKLDDVDEEFKLAMVLSELRQFAGPEDTYIYEILEGRSPQVAASQMLENTIFSNEKKLNKFLEKKPAKLVEKDDPIIEMARLLPPAYQKAVSLYQSTGEERNVLEEKVAREVFNVFGSSLPPDATFTLRISDGIVKGYEYNGTWAPYKTTFFGLYDRYYSHNQEDPWDLPERWTNPSPELLKAPYNFVNTCDIIGGNSGSPIINMDREAVGLVFDGNIESLPGNFIFDDEKNRSVGVHAGGIIAALQYIYKANRLLNELKYQK